MMSVYCRDLKVVPSRAEFKLKPSMVVHPRYRQLPGRVRCQTAAEGPEFVGGVDYLDLLIIHRHIVVTALNMTCHLQTQI